MIQHLHVIRPFELDDTIRRDSPDRPYDTVRLLAQAMTERRSLQQRARDGVQGPVSPFAEWQTRRLTSAKCGAENPVGQGNVMTDDQPGAVSTVAVPSPSFWDKEADIVVIGSGATGMPAAIWAREAGASVILVEAEPDIGGHAITSGGNVPLGGGTAAQRASGILDSPDLVFLDNTDWSVVQPNGFPDYRYNDREIVRAFADENVSTYDWLLAHGVVFADKPPDAFGGTSIGNSALREMHTVPMHWTIAQTGRPEPAATAATRSTGNGLMRPLETAARKAGVEILLEHRMTAIHRESPGAGRVTGIQAAHVGNVLGIRARKAVIIATGGHTGNVEFRRMFDPRLTEEYCGLGGMPWSDQDASGEIAPWPSALRYGVFTIRPASSASS